MMNDTENEILREQEMSNLWAEEILADEVETQALEEIVPDSLAFDLDYVSDEKQEEKIWQARTGLNYETLCGAIETIIFMNDRPISLTKIKALIDEDLPLRVVHEAILRLQKEYEEKHHGIRLQEVAEGYQFRTKATFSKYVQDILKVNSLVLTPTALEVLAIIAYKQPVSKVEVERIRGVDSSHIIRALMDKRLVKVTGRSEELGRPVLYGTTLEFLEVFNLPSLSALPPEHELHSMSESDLGKISDIKSILVRGDAAKFQFDEMEELERLSESIKSISAETSFTKSLSQEESKKVLAEGVVKKTAFEILEEYLNSEIISDQNKAAVLSGLLIPGVTPKVISDLEQGLIFNAPQLEEEEFQMVDVETGEVITDSNLVENDGDLFIEQESNPTLLKDALDEAYSKYSVDENEQEMENAVIEEFAQDIDQITQKTIDEAALLDLDLNFLNEEKVEDRENHLLQ